MNDKHEKYEILRGQNKEENVFIPKCLIQEAPRGQSCYAFCSLVALNHFIGPLWFLILFLDRPQKKNINAYTFISFYFDTSYSYREAKYRKE